LVTVSNFVEGFAAGSELKRNIVVGDFRS
jgi:hypothetical protein